VPVGPVRRAVECLLSEHRKAGVVVLPGYCHHRPNLPQRLVVRVSGTPVGAWLLSRSLRRIDGVVLRLTSGRRTFTSVATGLPAIVLVTTGARSGQCRRTTVLGIPLGDAIAVVGGNFGQRSAPAWAHNLTVHPAADVEFGGHTIAVTARITAGAERAMALASAIDLYPPYATYLRWTTRRDVPVFVLDPLAARHGT
jgi:deazaflavin-dependent oxidoreductase (nitroreductase family)